MNAGGFRGVANGASVKRRAAERTEAEMPARQKQHARFLFPAAPAHSVPDNAAVVITTGALGCHRFVGVATAARLLVVHHLFLLLLLVLDLRQDLLQIASQSVRRGLVGLSQVSPYLILHAQ